MVLEFEVLNGYNAIGNITSKTGIGTYTYPASGASSVRPHAVSSITGTVNGVVNPSYGYDINGNMTAGAGRTVAYTAFNMADTITQGATSYALSYDDDHQRIKQCIGASCATSATYYLNAAGTMAEKFVAGATTTWRDYLQVDGKIVGERFCTGAAPCTASAAWTWFALDHLGSIVLVTNGAGAVVERDSDDAWGLRRNPNGTDAVCGSIVSVTTRNFTGHEMIDGACLVNMNARIYDPQIARFMTVDPLDWLSWQNEEEDGRRKFGEYVENPQNLNVYAYVLNSPTAKTDPTGLDTVVSLQGYLLPQYFAKHAFVVITDTKTGQTIVVTSGQRGYNGISNTYLNQPATDTSGKVVMLRAEIEAGSSAVEMQKMKNKDLQPEVLTSKNLGSRPIEEVAKKARELVAATNDANLPYRPYGPENSNGFAGDVYRNLTGKKTEPNSKYPGLGSEFPKTEKPPESKM